MTSNAASVAVDRPAGDLHAQVIIKLGGQNQYPNRWEERRRWEIQREREREAARRRYLYNHRSSDRDAYRPRGYDYRDYRGGYRR